MLDVQALAAPMLQLLSSFGSGVLPTSNPAEALRMSSTTMDAVHSLGRAGLEQMAATWSGTASNVASDKAQAVQGSTATIADRGNSVADVVGLASADVNAGVAELGQILESFISLVVAAAPTLSTPAGQIMVVGAAIEHLGRALTVVARVRDQLIAHTANLLEHVVPDAVPTAPTIATQPAAVSTSQGADVGSQFISGLSQSAGGPPVSNMVSSFFSGSTPGTLPGSAVPGSPGVEGDGVEIRLPDGSTAIAPNEKAAAAVRHALSAQGTPYVWGGTTPGGGFDCSGLTQWAYGESGVGIPRTAAEQAIGMPVDAGSLMPGDLAVWDGHVAMVIGNGMLVEAGDPVEVGALRTSNMGMAFHGFYRPTAGMSA